jgi:hypothetical protein
MKPDPITITLDADLDQISEQRCEIVVARTTIAVGCSTPDILINVLKPAVAGVVASPLDLFLHTFYFCAVKE